MLICRNAEGVLGQRKVWNTSLLGMELSLHSPMHFFTGVAYLRGHLPPLTVHREPCGYLVNSAMVPNRSNSAPKPFLVHIS